MSETYDTETLKAIIQEAKRQGYDDKLIALNLGIARSDPAFGFSGDDQLRASVSELHRRGYHLETIAEDLDLPLVKVLELHGDNRLRIGLWGVYSVCPFEPHHESNILMLIERARASLAKETLDGKIALLGRNPNRNETLALLADTIGLESTRDLIANFLLRLGNGEPVAVALHIPETAVRAVLFGCFPVSETAPTLQ